MGRPSIDPELMIRMLLIGYVYGIRSERRLVEEVHLNLAYRWFCGLGLRVADLLLQHPYIYLSLARLLLCQFLAADGLAAIILRRRPGPTCRGR
jgi:hypothetical protein